MDAFKPDDQLVTDTFYKALWLYWPKLNSFQIKNKACRKSFRNLIAEKVLIRIRDNKN